VFNEGYDATAGESLIRRELCAEAIRLARLVADLMPDEPEALGLLALLLLTDARRDARSHDGELVLLEDQDRGRWDRVQIAEGREILGRAWRSGRPGSYSHQAAIALAHDTAPTHDATPWPRIVELYAMLERLEPGPVVRLNLAVAAAMAAGPERGLERMDALQAELAEYPYLHAARADLLRRLGRIQESQLEYERALELSGNASERRFLERRLREVGGSLPT
jgi:RNA polymerase sigma-70 factor (ECF subfamily)